MPFLKRFYDFSFYQASLLFVIFFIVKFYFYVQYFWKISGRNISWDFRGFRVLSKFYKSSFHRTSLNILLLFIAFIARFICSISVTAFSKQHLFGAILQIFFLTRLFFINLIPKGKLLLNLLRNLSVSLLKLDFPNIVGVNNCEFMFFSLMIIIDVQLVGQVNSSYQ